MIEKHAHTWIMFCNCCDSFIDEFPYEPTGTEIEKFCAACVAEREEKDAAAWEREDDAQRVNFESTRGVR